MLRGMRSVRGRWESPLAVNIRRSEMRCGFPIERSLGPTKRPPDYFPVKRPAVSCFVTCRTDWPGTQLPRTDTIFSRFGTPNSLA